MTYLDLMRRNLKLGYAQSFFHHLLFFLPIWYAFEVQFASVATLGIIYAAAHFVTVILELPTGALADLIGRKKTIFLGLLLEGTAWILISQATSASYLWVGYLLSGVANALVSGADIALFFDSIKELKNGLTYAKFNAKSGIITRTAIITGTFLGGYIFTLSPGLPYLLVGVSVIISAIIGLFLTEPKIDSEQFSLANYLKQTKLGFRQTTKSPFSTKLSLFYILVGGITWYYMYFLNQVYATDIGFSAVERSWIFSGIALVAAIIISFVAGSKKITRRTIYLTFPLLLTLGFIPAYWATGWLALFCLLLVQLAGIGRFALLSQYVNDEFESKYRATAISALNMFVSLLFILLSAIGGKVIELVSSPAMMSLLGIASLLLVLPTSLAVINSRLQ